MNQIKQGYKQTKVGIIPEDWEVVKLGELSNKIGSGITPTGGETVYQSSGRFFIRSQNVGLGSLLLDDVAYISDEIHSTFKNTEIKQNDILLNITGASIGRCAIANKTIEGGNVNQHVCIIRPKINKIDTKFLTTFLLSHQGQKQIDSFQAGGNRQGLNFAQIASFITPLPPLKEQEKIAEILTTWDEAITKQTELLRAKELQKKALMQKLLSGEVRFGGFTDEWDEVRLGEICEYKNGGAFEEYIIENGKYLLITLNSIDISGKLKVEHKTVNINDNSLKKDDLIMVLSDVAHGDFLGLTDVILENDRYVLNQRMGALKPKKNLNSFFLSKLINLNQRYFKRHGQGSSQQNLSKGDITKFKIKLPSLPEQQKIAEVLSLADDEINLLKNELEELKLQKKALMQKLLTGEVRVKV
ncbi:restriction endonuclease subunit S [Aliarcobacter cryaerophilus]|uniref:restriction endonuclease subunit S n=1 Tax=Aliarcobacter cryaerophilus TaxID=28198 RepID=UPI003DA29173